jgi:hypothetical protein
MKYLLLLPLLLLPLFGCADSSTTGNIRGYDIRVDISQNSAPVSLTFPLTVDATSSTDQTTEGEASIAPDVNLQLVQPGATGSLSGADSILKDTVSKFQNLLKKDAEQEAVEQLPVVPSVAPPAAEEPVAPTEPVIPSEPTEPNTGELTYETKFHHTQTNGPDPGKSLVMCPGQRMDFDRCTSNGVVIPRHKDGDGRETYWNMTEEPEGDIVCTKGDKKYLYPATITDSRGFVWGDC